MHDVDDTRNSYDLVAEDYAREIYDELQYKPLDRELLDRFARRTLRKGPVCDVGCGPGQIARYLHDQGVEALGLDLSPRMVEVAQRLNPGINFQQGDMRALPYDDNSLAGIAAFYSILHIPREHMVVMLRGFYRALQPEGLLLIGLHRGQEPRHLSEWWGKNISLDVDFFLPQEMMGYLQAANFHVDEVIEREPYPEVEYPSQRVYIFASKPAE